MDKRNKKKVVDCLFCESGKIPDYKKYEELRNYVSDRARIYGALRTGVCSKHQRALSREVKRARHLGLLPFSTRPGN